MFHSMVGEKTIGNKKPMPMFFSTVATAIAIILLIATPKVWAQGEFEVAELFFELNDTDGDLGIHALIDGEAWKELEIEAPNGREMLDIQVKGRLKRQGLTEIFFESAEPTFDELAPADFFDRFPEGTYEIEGETLNGRELENAVELTHVMPAPAGGITLNDVTPNLELVDCDDEDTVPSVAANPDGSVIISWDPVMESHPNPDGGGAAVQPPVLVTIVNYEVVVEKELEINGEEFISKYNVILPPDVTTVTIPGTFLEGVDEYKYEILAREESYNQTAVESCFALVE